MQVLGPQANRISTDRNVVKHEVLPPEDMSVSDLAAKPKRDNEKTNEVN